MNLDLHSKFNTGKSTKVMGINLTQKINLPKYNSKVPESYPNNSRKKLKIFNMSSVPNNVKSQTENKTSKITKNKSIYIAVKFVLRN